MLYANAFLWFGLLVVNQCFHYELGYMLYASAFIMIWFICCMAILLFMIWFICCMPMLSLWFGLFAVCQCFHYKLVYLLYVNAFTMIWSIFCSILLSL